MVSLFSFLLSLFQIRTEDRGSLLFMRMIIGDNGERMPVVGLLRQIVHGYGGQQREIGAVGSPGRKLGHEDGEQVSGL